MRKATWVALALAVSLALGATPAGAVTIGAGNFAEPFMPPTYGPNTSQFLAVVIDPITFDISFSHIADLAVSVWQVDASKYIYGLKVSPSPSTANISLFGTAFPSPGVQGISLAAGSAGWRFSDAALAGGVGNASDFVITVNGDGNLTWERQNSFWNNQVPITFYFTSSLPWGESVYTYSLTNLLSGETVNTAPAAVPEPSSLLLLGSGLLAFGFVRRSVRLIRE